MFFALDNGRRIKAEPKKLAECPGCRGPVRSACGKIISWHWKHVAGGDCDPWSEPEGEWHAWWKSRFPEEWREVVIGNHRADIVTPFDIIELQHSAITGEMVEERETFYGPRLVWIFDIRGFRDRVMLTGEADRVGFEFGFPKKAIRSCKRRVLIDCGGGTVIEPKIWHQDGTGNARRGQAVLHLFSDSPSSFSGDRIAWTPRASAVGPDCDLPGWTLFAPPSKRVWKAPYGACSPVESSSLRPEDACAGCFAHIGRHVGKNMCCPPRSHVIEFGKYRVPGDLPVSDERLCKGCGGLWESHASVKFDRGNWYWKRAS